MYSPNSQSESYYNPNGSSRYRDDTIRDGYANRDVSNIVSQEPQVFRGSPHNNDLHGRNFDRYASGRPVKDVNKATGSNSRNMEDFVDNYEPRYMTTSENERIWAHHGDENSRRDQLMKGKRNEFGHKGNDVANSRDQSRDYEFESAKFNRAREGREEFKQVQKKSVLLRIGKPNNTSRNRNHDQHLSKPYMVESNNSNFRGKDKEKDKDKDRDHIGKDSSLYLDKRVEGERERSPVELDVSFKSNALVAKAVVTPSSPVCDNNHSQPRNKKSKRSIEFDSPLSKFNERSTRSRSSSHGLECSSSSEKAPKHPRDKDSVRESTLSAPVLDQNVGSGGSNGPLSFRLKKKRKLLNLASRASAFQLAEKEEKSVKGENSKNKTSVPLRSVISFPSLDELIANKVDESPEPMLIEKDVSEVKNLSLHDINSFSNDLTAQKVSTTNDDMAKNDLGQQLGQDEVSLDLGKDTQKVSTDVKESPGGTDISASSRDDQIDVPKESYVGCDAANVTNSLCNVPVEIQEISTSADMNSIGPCSDEINDELQAFLDDVSRKIVESQLLEGTKESPSAVVTAEDNTILSSDETDFSVVKKTTKDLKTSGEKHKDVGATPSSSIKEISSDIDEVTETVKWISASVQTLKPDYKEPTTDEIHLLPKDGLPSSSFITDSNDKLGESVPAPTIGNTTDHTASNSSVPKKDVDICEQSLSKDATLLNGLQSSIKTSLSEVTNPKINSSASQGSRVKTSIINTKTQGPSLPPKKPSPASVVPRVFTGHSTPVFTNSSRINNPAKNIARPRTWHRSASTPVTKSSSVNAPPLPKQSGMSQNSYIRSGNTLVRKSSPVTAVSSVPSASKSSIYQLNPSGPIETRNGIYSRTNGPTAPVVRPKTPPLSSSLKLPDITTISSRDLLSEQVPVKGNCEEEASPVEGNFASEDQIGGSSSNSESQKILEERSAGKKIRYVKRKSNQLVAASSNDQSVQDLLDKTQASSSDGYYKRRKNQLIRTSVGGESDVPKASKINIKRQSNKGVFKMYKHLRFPSVWTLNSQSSGKDGVSLRQKLRPHLFPWKRSRYGGNVMNVSSSTPSNNSSSSISSKLLLSRKRDMIYTRSKHGFSLHMSKLLSVGGSSLKWSKSIEKNSKRANEEATLAVAAAEKKKREQHDTAEIKSMDNMYRDRVFRVGLVRYKMDPSRRTLQRISDEETSTSVQPKEELRKPYVPKRLLIGYNEYVRIGNGNQLVRNPKRRTRIFANEKVRWSLHTARSRLAKKKKYCQFFTRFGKCNKDDGKCPYIHDPSKIAVCTKFLNGSCSNPNCKLTHEVIPERMQDCSYFSQGLCSNKHCPYRHVNVNSVASVCEGFLKGYCAVGNECRKKHTYACPVFEATGACPQGTKCKLHHRKNRNMGLKRKQQHVGEQKNARGRYFGSYMGGELMHVSPKHYLKDNDGDMLCQEGKFAEYIGLLDFSNEEVGEVMSEKRKTVVSEPVELGAVDFDELMKPNGIMNRIVVGVS